MWFPFKAYFDNEAISPQSLLDSIRTTADQILQSVDTPQQNDLQSEVNALSESVKNCLAAASDRQDQLDKDSRAYKEYEKSLEEIKQAIIANTQSTEETATNIPALKTLIAGLESKLVVLQVISLTQWKKDPNLRELMREFQSFLLIQTEQAKLKTLQDKVKKVEQRADVASRQTIQESYSTVAKDWRDIQDGLMMRCSDLNDLVDTWEVRWPRLMISWIPSKDFGLLTISTHTLFLSAVDFQIASSWCHLDWPRRIRASPRHGRPVPKRPGRNSQGSSGQFYFICLYVPAIGKFPSSSSRTLCT